MMQNEDPSHQPHIEAATRLRRTTAEYAVAIADALDAFVLAAGTPRETQRTVRALREIADFTHDAAIELAIAGNLGAPEPRLHHQLASWKLKEVGATLALHIRGEAEPAVTGPKSQSQRVHSPSKKRPVTRVHKNRS